MKLGFLWLCTELRENCGKAFRGSARPRSGETRETPLGRETKVPCDMNTALLEELLVRGQGASKQGAGHDANSERPPADYWFELAGEFLSACYLNRMTSKQAGNMS